MGAALAYLAIALVLLFRPADATPADPCPTGQVRVLAMPSETWQCTVLPADEETP